MTHEELRERLLDLAYGELSPRDARKVEEHAASCEACRAELGRIRETRRLMSALPEEPAPAEGERILLAAARGAAGRRGARILPPWLLGGSLVAVSLAAIVAVSFRVASMRPRSPGRDDPNALMGESPYARAPQPGATLPDRREPQAASPQQRQGTGAAATPAPAAERRERKNERKNAEMPRRAPVADADAAQAAPEPPATPAGPPPPAAPPRETADTEAPAAGLSTRAAPPRFAPAPAPSRASKAGAPSAARAPEAAPEGVAGSPGPGPDPVARREALRAAGRLRVEERTFPGCKHELWRRVERDADGRVVSYAWEEMVGTQRLRFEAIYGLDGGLVRKQALDAATSAPEPAVKFRVPPASRVDIDAPPRCSRAEE